MAMPIVTNIPDFNRKELDLYTKSNTFDDRFIEPLDLAINPKAKERPPQLKLKIKNFQKPVLAKGTTTRP